MYLENNREIMPKLCLGSERTIETDPIYASSGCPKKRGQFETDTIKDMQTSAYLQSYLFRTGDAYLVYAIYEHDLLNKLKNGENILNHTLKLNKYLNQTLNKLSNF